MPIIPKFQISQDDEFVYVRINVPYVKVSETEVIAEDCDFSFYCRPYLLKLTFPHPLDGSDEERCRAVYDPTLENGLITAYLPKLNAGQVFEDLDLTTILLQKRIQKDRIPGIDARIPSIEVIESVDYEAEDVDEAANGIATAEQSAESSSSSSHPHPRPDLSIMVNKPKYGFNQNYSNVLGVLSEDSILELQGNPDHMSAAMRYVKQIETENELFSPVRYLGDLYQGEQDCLYQEIMKYEPFWSIAWNNRKDENGLAILEFDDLEKETMVALPNKEYLIKTRSSEERVVFLSMIDILYAFCYEYRFSMGEISTESPDSVTKLSSVLSWLRVYDSSSDSLSSVIKSACRRSIIYPYLRVWKISRRVLADVAKILFLGKRCLLKCFLRLYHLFEHTEQYYILNKLYISDYCVWLQRVDEHSLESFAKEFNEAKRSFEASDGNGKSLIGFNLLELEAWSREHIAKMREEGEDLDEMGLDCLPDIPPQLTSYSSE
jgi:protein SHQ1